MKVIDKKVYRAYGAAALRALGMTWTVVGRTMGVSDSSLRRDLKAMPVEADEVSSIKAIEESLKSRNFRIEDFKSSDLPGKINMGVMYLDSEGTRASRIKSLDTGKLYTTPQDDAPEAEAPKEQVQEEATQVVEDAPTQDGAPEAPKVPLQYLLTEHALVVIRDGKPLQVDRDHRNFDKVREALKEGDARRVFDLIDLRSALTRYTHLGVEVKDDGVFFSGIKLDGRLSQRMVKALGDEDESALERLSKFLIKCHENPSFRVVTRIYDFMMANDLEIDEDGDILAFKVVRGNFLDKHSGIMDNSPGKTVSMPRNQVQDDDRITCSEGLHACARSYIKFFSDGGDKLVLLKINPADVVSIPTDYSNAKMRTCKYVVLKELETL